MLTLRNNRSFPSFGSTAISQRLMPYTREFCHPSTNQVVSIANETPSGVDPLTPDDIAEVIVFVAGRRENVVVADTLIFPNHQAGAGVMHRKS